MGEANPFLKAIEVLRERGWHQGGFSDGSDPATSPVCAWGALNVAYGAFLPAACVGNADLAAEFLFALVQQDHDVHSLPDFNDDPSTSQEDVELLLKKAAVAWDSREERS